MDEFIKSKSMLASGVLGATTTMITGAMATQFGLPGNITALVVSFSLCTLVFTDKSLPNLQRIIFYFINSMIVFTTAIGINTAGVAATQNVQTRKVVDLGGPEVVQPAKDKAYFHPWF